MKIVLTLLLFSVTALAGQPCGDKQTKPAIIQDGSAAESYITKALYELLDQPPYLAAHPETPFVSKEIDGKSVWMSLVEFYCGFSQQDSVRCETVIIYDPKTNQHQFINPDLLPASPDKEAPGNKISI